MYLITGISGQLGYDIKRELLRRGVPESDIFAPDSSELDITDIEAVENYVENLTANFSTNLSTGSSTDLSTTLASAPAAPDATPEVRNVIFHCAAYTNVDGAETNADLCRKVNVDGTRNLVKAAEKIGAKLIYISTDYVFDGENPEPYAVDAATGPRSVYGKTKLDGELAVRDYPRHFIVRTAWVFGINGKNFVRTILKVAGLKPRAESAESAANSQADPARNSQTNPAESAENSQASPAEPPQPKKPTFREEVSVVDDQVGSPTYTVDLAKFLVDLSASEKYGTYHATNEGFCSWAEFTEEIYKVADVPTHVKKVTTEDYIALAGRPQATRPKYSKLSKSKIPENGFEPLPDWRDATKRYILELKKEGEL